MTLFFFLIVNFLYLTLFLIDSFQACYENAPLCTYHRHYIACPLKKNNTLKKINYNTLALWVSHSFWNTINLQPSPLKKLIFAHFFSSGLGLADTAVRAVLSRDAPRMDPPPAPPPAPPASALLKVVRRWTPPVDAPGPPRLARPVPPRGFLLPTAPPAPPD